MPDFGKPTLNDCRAWIDTLNDDWLAGSGGDTSLDSQQAGEEDVYYQRFTIRAPDGHWGVRTGSAPSDADAAIDKLTPSDMMVKVQPARANKKYRTQADKLVRFGKALLHDWRRRQDVVGMFAADMVIRRVAVFRVMYDSSLWPLVKPATFENDEAEEIWEVQNRRKNPIILERRNPRYTRWRVADDGTVLAVLEEYLTTALELRRMYPDNAKVTTILKGSRADDVLVFQDIWLGDYRCVMVEQQPIFPGRGGGEYEGVMLHTYPVIPYVIVPFREIPADTPGERYRGLLTNARELYPIESQVMSMHLSQLAWNAWRTWTGWFKDNRAIEIVPGSVVRIDKRVGEYLEMLQGEAVPPELLQMVSIIDTYLQRNASSAGPRTADGTRSAQQVWAMQAQRQERLDIPQRNLERGLRRALELASMIAEQKLTEPITLPVPGTNREGDPLGEVRIDPKQDIAGYWDAFTVQFSRRLDPALLEQAKALAGLATTNWMPMRVSWELSGLTDTPQDWEDELLMQATERLPFIIEVTALKRLQAEVQGTEDEWMYMTYRQQLQQAQQAGRPAQPGAPGMPGRGMASQPAGAGMQGPQGAPPVGQAIAAGTTPHGGGGRHGGGRPQGPAPGAAQPRGGR